MASKSNVFDYLDTDDNREPGPYVKLTKSQVPSGWTNRPERLGVYDVDIFAITDEILNVRAWLKRCYKIPDARPILNSDTRRALYLLEGGDGKYYLYEIEDYVARIEEGSLEKILKAVEGGGISNLPYTIL
jgi:hypothetical protein